LISPRPFAPVVRYSIGRCLLIENRRNPISIDIRARPRQEALARIDAGETLADIALTYGVDVTTIGRLKN
jgi:hypothetical protein